MKTGVFRTLWLYRGCSAAAVLFVFSAIFLSADEIDDYTWKKTSGSNFNWSNSANWDGRRDRTPGRPQDRAIFNNPAGMLEPWQNRTMSDGLGQLVFNYTGWEVWWDTQTPLRFYSFPYFSNNAINVWATGGAGEVILRPKIEFLSAGQNVHTATGATLVIRSGGGFIGNHAPVISSFNPTANDTGAVRLDAASTVTGAFFLRQGTLLIRHNDALGASSATVNIGGDAWTTDKANARLLTDAVNITVPKNLRVRAYANRNVNATLGGNQTSGASTFSGTLTLDLDTNLQSANTDGNAVSFNGAISGAGGIRKTGVGTVVFGAANTYHGDTLVETGTLRLGPSGALPSATTVWLANTAGAVLDLNGRDQTVAMLTGGGAAGGDISLGTATLTVGLGNYGGTISGSGGLTKNGSGILTLNRAQAYTGATTVADGTLRYGVSHLLHDSSDVTVSGPNAVLDLQGHSDQVGNVTLLGGRITGTGTAQLVSTGAGGYDLRSGRVEAILGGSADLTKTTAGTVVLAQYGNFQGTTRVMEGSLVLEHPEALRFSTVNLRSEDTGDLEPRGQSATFGGLSGDRDFGIPVRQTLSVGRNNASTAYHGVLSGDEAVLEKTGTGTLTLSANQAYTGRTTITQGTLQLGDGGTSGWVEGPIINHGSLAFRRSDDVVFSEAISGMGVVMQNGGGVLDLAGPMSFEGSMLVHSGTLLFNSHLPYHEWSIVRVGHPLGAPGQAVLGGTGRIDRWVEVNASGVIAPGNSIGRLEFGGDVVFAAGGTLRIQLADGGQGECDLIVVDETLYIQEASLVFEQVAPLTQNAYVFASYGTLVGDIFAQVIGLPDGYWIDYDYLGLSQIALVPEPRHTALVMALFTAFFVLALGKRRVPTENHQRKRKTR